MIKTAQLFFSMGGFYLLLKAKYSMQMKKVNR